MQLSFGRAHSSMLTQYIGMSCITGAIAHWFFSETRALITGVVGIILFTIGSYFEGAHSGQIHWKVILSGALLAVGIGAVTGGLQHFPDSPERSVWVIPVGLALCLWFYAKNHGYILRRKELQYILIVMTIGILISLILYGLIEYASIAGHSHA